MSIILANKILTVLDPKAQRLKLCALQGWGIGEQGDNLKLQLSKSGSIKNNIDKFCELIDLRSLDAGAKIQNKPPNLEFQECASEMCYTWDKMTKRTTKHMKSIVLFLRKGKSFPVRSCLI